MFYDRFNKPKEESFGFVYELAIAAVILLFGYLGNLLILGLS